MADPVRSARNKRYNDKKAEAAQKPSQAAAKRTWFSRVPDMLASWARAPKAVGAANPFAAAPPPPGMAPKGQALAMDEACGSSAWAYNSFAAGYGSYGGLEGATNLPHLALLSQQPEHRRAVETISTEMTRKWIKFGSTSDDGDGDELNDKITKLQNAFDRLHVRDVFRKAADHDGYFGRAHIFPDFGNVSDTELKTSIGNGADAASKSKVAVGSLKGLRNVEPMWAYPQGYNTTNPLSPEWYNPQAWLVMGREVHASRLLTLVGREVPDILKPAYMFGGVSLIQMLEPYVRRWHKTVRSVSDLIYSFSVSGVKTNLQSTIGAGGDNLAGWAQTFNDMRDNKGLMLLDKDTEEFFNVTTPLASLDSLQAQSQEHVASTAAIPLVKYTGLQPSGLNASSEGELRNFYDWTHARQEHLFAKPLDKIFHLVQLSEFGQIDPDLTYSFEPLWSMSEKELAEVKKIEAETAQLHIDTGTISPQEERQRIASDPDSGYDSLDVDDMPDLREEENAGLVLKGEEGEADLEQTEFKDAAE